ncbi:ATP-binding protein [Plantactinospora siamensis]|uniref:ATP-binding protein n=1 Tax=Plantactinospora siamensis TaxID=555372 RepID=A0ABV6NV28_9ACTN
MSDTDAGKLRARRSRPDEPSGISYHQPGDLAVVRAFVHDRAVASGLSAERAELLVLAVSELATNTLQHAAGGGRVTVRVEGDEVVCEVVDRGAARTFGREMPDAVQPRGRGLAIVERLCDGVSTATRPDGTAVVLRLRR